MNRDYCQKNFFFFFGFSESIVKRILTIHFLCTCGKRNIFFLCRLLYANEFFTYFKPLFTFTSSPFKQPKCSPADVYIRLLIWTLHSRLIVTTADIRIHLLKCVEPDLFVATGSIFDAWCFWWEFPLHLNLNSWGTFVQSAFRGLYTSVYLIIFPSEKMRSKKVAITDLMCFYCSLSIFMVLIVFIFISFYLDG